MEKMFEKIISEGKKSGKSVEEISVSDLSFTIEYRAPVETPWWLEFLPFIITALLFMVLLFNLITKLVYAPALAVVSLFVLTLALYRTFSKRLEARRREDAWFSGVLKKVSAAFGQAK